MAELFLWLPWLMFSVVAICFLDMAVHAARRRNLPPPGPRPLPLIGSLHLLGSQPHRSLARLAQTHGPLMSLRLGAVTTVVASSPQAAREVLQKHDAAFAARFVPDSIVRHARNSMAWLPASSPRWRALRKVMTTVLFAPHRLDALQGLRREKARELVDHVGSRAASKGGGGGAPVRVGLVVFTTMLNLLSRTIFSRDLVADLDDDHRGAGESSREFHQVVLGIMEVSASPNVSDFFPALAAADLQGRRRRMDELSARLRRVFDREVDQRMVGRSVGELPKNVFLDLLLNAAVDDDGAVVLDRKTLRSMFSDLFGAGADTSSSTVEWAMAELLQNPPSMTKACDELRRVTGGSRRNIEESEIGQLPYLQAVIKETFRLHPPVPFLLPRQAEKTTKVMGYTIPKGSRVLVNVWAIGRDADVWSEPEKFMPERFLARAADFRGGNDFDLIPFGAGRRICPGMPLAIRMVHLVLGSLLNQFEWRLPEEEERNGVDMSENFGMTLVKAVPLRAILAHHV